MTDPSLGPFSSSELDAIRAAVDRAEEGTTGEIVTVIAERCGTYPEARWRAALIGALAASVLAAAVHARLGGWTFDPWLGATLPALLGALAGYLSARQGSTIERMLADRDGVQRIVFSRAEAAFLEESVFQTETRSGILLFVALAERRAVVLADEGIHGPVPPERWSDIVEILTAGMRAGQPTSGLMRAVEACGEILRAYAGREHLAKGPPDVDELDDQPRLRTFDGSAP